MKKYGIIGYPLAQSASPKFFNEKFAAEGIDALYIPFEIESTDELPHIIEQHPELCGFNVTIPHKLNVMQHLAGISDEAKAINAVNVVKVMRDSNGKAQLWGYNSDVIGFSRSIEPLLGNNHKKALVLGTGGASKAIVYALEKLGLEVQQVSRKSNEKAIAYEDITHDIMQSHTVIVNSTPLGMVGHGIDQCPDIPYDLLGESHLLYDIVYNPENTLFLSGYEMWYLQALASWEIWND